MKPPLSYYGGKQRMVKEILPLIPKHSHYTEVFFGGGAVFFAKKPVNHEVINDVNNNLITFYRVLKNNFQALHNEIDSTLHSEAIYQFTKEIYQNPNNFGEVSVAYATWVQCNMSFSNKPKAGFAFQSETPLSANKTYNYVRCNWGGGRRKI